MKKKMAAVFLAGILTSSFLLTGCGNSTADNSSASSSSSASSASASGDLLEQIQSKGEIVVAMEGTWAPWTYHDEDDNLVGYDVEVAQQIAEKLGVKATFVEGEWDGLLAGIDSGRYDIMVNGVDITEERAEKYSFSDPYAHKPHRSVLALQSVFHRLHIHRKNVTVAFPLKKRQAQQMMKSKLRLSCKHNNLSLQVCLQARY